MGPSTVPGPPLTISPPPRSTALCLGREVACSTGAQAAPTKHVLLAPGPLPSCCFLPVIPNKCGDWLLACEHAHARVYVCVCVRCGGPGAAVPMVGFLGVGNMGEVLLEQVRPVDSCTPARAARTFHEEAVDVGALPGWCRHVLPVLLGHLHRQAHLVQRPLVLPGHRLHDGREE